MCGALEMIQLYDSNTGEQIDEFREPNGWQVKSVCCGYQGLAVAISTNRTHDSCQLTFWRTDSFRRTTYLDHLRIPVPGHECTYGLWMDDNFVTVFQHSENSRSVFIVSIKTRKIVENIVDSLIEDIRYERGLLIMKYPSFIIVGSLSHQAQGPIEFLIHIGNITEGVHISFMTNSKYLVLLTSAPFIANVYLYDVQAIKKKTTPFNVIFFEIPFYVDQPEMDETQLVFVGRKHGSSNHQIAVLDFSRIEPF